MFRFSTLGLAIAAAGLLASSASAAPSFQVASPDAGSVVQVRYGSGGCPPGYKVTSHGGCKLTKYVRHHPAQNPNNYDNDYYDDQAPPPPPPPYGYRPAPRYDDGY